MPDFYVFSEGTIWTFEPMTEAARVWWENNVATEPWQYVSPNVCGVDHRYAEDLIKALQAEGYSIND